MNNRWLVLTVAVGISALGPVGCDDTGGATDTDAAGVQKDAAAGDATSPDAGPGSPWDLYSWTPIRSDGDPSGDCASEDASCEADLAQLYYAVEGGLLCLDLRFHRDFPVEQGSYEIFLIPADKQVVGHTVQVIAGTLRYWEADCSTAARLRKHGGCHWHERALPSTLVAEWLAGDRLVLSVSLGQLGAGALSELLVGVGAAPTPIQVTAEFTDRYPDQVWVTATEIQGLQAITLTQ